MYSAVCKKCNKEYYINKRMETCPYCHEKGLLMNVGLDMFTNRFNYAYKVFIHGYRNEIGCIAEFGDAGFVKEFCDNSDRLYIQINKKEKPITPKVVRFTQAEAKYLNWLLERIQVYSDVHVNNEGSHLLEDDKSHLLKSIEFKLR